MQNRMVNGKFYLTCEGSGLIVIWKLCWFTYDSSKDVNGFHLLVVQSKLRQPVNPAVTEEYGIVQVIHFPLDPSQISMASCSVLEKLIAQFFIHFLLVSITWQPSLS